MPKPEVYNRIWKRLW